MQQDQTPSVDWDHCAEFKSWSHQEQLLHLVRPGGIRWSPSGSAWPTMNAHGIAHEIVDRLDPLDLWAFHVGTHALDAAATDPVAT